MQALFGQNQISLTQVPFENVHCSALCVFQCHASRSNILTVSFSRFRLTVAPVLNALCMFSMKRIFSPCISSEFWFSDVLCVFLKSTKLRQTMTACRAQFWKALETTYVASFVWSKSDRSGSSGTRTCSMVYGHMIQMLPCGRNTLDRSQFTFVTRLHL